MVDVWKYICTFKQHVIFLNIQKKKSIIFQKFAPELKKPLPAKMCFPSFFLQKCIFTKNAVLQSQHKYKCWFEEIFACSQFFPQKCFFIDYQASRSPHTCKQVRGGTSLGLTILGVQAAQWAVLQHISIHHSWQDSTDHVGCNNSCSPAFQNLMAEPAVSCEWMLNSDCFNCCTSHFRSTALNFRMFLEKR